MMIHTEAQSFKISKHKNHLKKPSNPHNLRRLLKFVVYQNHEHDVTAVSNNSYLNKYLKSDQVLLW